METSARIEIDGRTVRLTHLEKRLWPRAGLTKADLIRYVIEAGPYLLRHLKDRPLTVRRFPDGVEKEGFYQKNRPAYAPEWIESFVDPRAEEGTVYVLANDLATLVWLANQGAIEFHPWMAPYSRPERPDFAVVDLDPGPAATFDDARRVAGLLRELLDELGVQSVAKTSGASGIHVYIPLVPVYTYATTHRFVGLLGELLARRDPKGVTTVRRVQERPPGAVYVDHLQNLRGKTVAAPYSPRPTPSATVATPFRWEELPDVDPRDFTLRSLTDVLHAADDFDRALFAGRQRLEEPLDRLRQRLEITLSAPFRRE